MTLFPNLIVSATICCKKEFRSFFYSSAPRLSVYSSFSEFMSTFNIILCGDVSSTSFTLTLSNILNLSSCLAVGLKNGFICSISSRSSMISLLVWGKSWRSVYSNLEVVENILFRYSSPSWSCTKEKSLWVLMSGCRLKILKSWSFLLIFISCESSCTGDIG